jgi:Mlc titration factor MtfA (ptsG expression regulator)
VPSHGLNVVHHEFAHQLDLLDGTLDGTPPLDDHLRPRWVRICTATFQALRARPDEVLRDYGGESPAEFFAVATEVFFARPLELADHHPELYEVLRAFYRQDPASRRRPPDPG